MLLAFAAAAQHSPSAYSQELFAAATEFLWEGLGQLEPCGLADVAAAYAAVQHYDDDEDFFNGVAAAALQRLQVGVATALSCTADGLCCRALRLPSTCAVSPGQPYRSWATTSICAGNFC
jgi:hypothetical protein